MPNHVTNHLIWDKNESEILEYLKGDGKHPLIDFNKLVPTPQIIKDVGEISSNMVSSVHKAKKYTPSSGNLLLDSLEIQNIKNAKDSFEDPVEQKQFELACQCFDETGFAYWYDWNLANWGTKWNAYSQAKIENGIKFETAWSSIPNLIEAISKKFPDVKFIYQWADEDTGSNVGYIEFQNGVGMQQIIKNQSNEAYELCFELNPDSKDYYEFKDGKWKYKDED